MKAISILGSTGSIGCNTLKVVEHLQEFRVIALGAGRNVEKLADQIARFNPEFVSCEDEICALFLRNHSLYRHTITYTNLTLPTTPIVCVNLLMRIL